RIAVLKRWAKRVALAQAMEPVCSWVRRRQCTRQQGPARRASCRWSRPTMHRGSRAAKPRSPCDRSLLRGVDAFFAARLEEKRFHGLREKAARLRIHQVQTVVVDEHHLLAGPLIPAVLTNLALYACADRPGKGRALESRSRLTTPAAGHVCHNTLMLALGGKITGVHCRPSGTKKAG